MLYQLSYFRKNKPHQSASSCPHQTFATPIGFKCGKRWIRTTEGVRQQIYSLPHLATLVSSQYFRQLSGSLLNLLSRWRDSNPRPRDYKSRALANWATSAYQPFTGCKGRDIFYFCKFFGKKNAQPTFFASNMPYSARSKNFDFPLFS